MAKLPFDLFANISSINSDKTVDIVQFPTVHVDDSEPFTIIWPDIQRGPWIAGGAVLRWYQGQPVGDSDIDVFCRSPQQATTLIEEIKSYGRFYVKHKSENAVTIEYNNKDDFNKKWTIQIITKRFYQSAQEVIDNFDITVCEIATCGNEWIMNPQTARDIRERNLRFKMPLQTDAPKRLTKYWTYGYRPVEGTVEAICSNVDVRWKYEPGEEYDAI